MSYPHKDLHRLLADGVLRVGGDLAALVVASQDAGMQVRIYQGLELRAVLREVLVDLHVETHEETLEGARDI